MNTEEKYILYFSVDDLNNFISSNRKLILNNKEEFWVYDKVLAYNSQYFKKLLLIKEILPLKETKNTIE